MIKYMKSFRFILAGQYFLYFCVVGVTLPYFNLYCYHLNFSGFQIGFLSSIRTLATALFPILWGALADRFVIRKQIFVACNCMSAAIWALFLFFTDFTSMVVIMAFYGFFNAPIIPFLETFSLDLLDREKKRYGQLRAWGSFGFILTVIAVGKLIDAISTQIIIGLILAGLACQAAFSFKIPSDNSVHERPLLPFANGLLNRRLMIFLTCSFLMVASHGAYYGFFSIHLERIGFSATFIGITWAMATCAEILVMISSNKIFNRFSYENILLFTFFVAGCRWILLGIATSAGLILFLQMLHAFTYGAFHMSSILYIDKMTPRGSKTLGQATYNAITYGFGNMAGFLFGGYYFETLGAYTLFTISGIVAFLGGGILFFSRISEQPRA